jgi:phosphoribosylaminoimidazole-succinocarboxamide synthase
MNSAPVYSTDLSPLKLLNRGKVRDVYGVGDNLLVVSTDRLSAFDVILPEPIPGKGKILNKLSMFWLEKSRGICPNHLITGNVDEFPQECAPYADTLKGRSMIVKKARTFPVECVARGYVIGSGWKDYQKTGKICGITLPQGLKQAEKLPEPIFTPSTKAELGLHDENISFAKVKDLVGSDTANWLRDKTLEIYAFGAKWAEERGIIIADTKFEFGLSDNERILIDEVMTPDSSRFWPMDQYQVGMSPPSLDKQFVRDYLEEIKWDKNPPAPNLPKEIMRKTVEKYMEIYSILTGNKLDQTAMI